MSHTAAK